MINNPLANDPTWNRIYRQYRILTSLSSNQKYKILALSSLNKFYITFNRIHTNGEKYIICPNSIASLKNKSDKEIMKTLVSLINQLEEKEHEN